MSLKSKIKNWCRRRMLDFCHKRVVEKEWLYWKGYPIDWENPRDINEKIQWLMCFGDTSKWSLCSDKYRVRDYVKEKGFGDLLIPLLGAWETAEEIDFDLLPEKFVIKCNHDSGSFHIVDKSKGFDAEAIRKDLASHLKTRFGYMNGEMYYNRIKPCIIAEELLEPEEQPFTSSIVDYKFWCFDGKPYGVWVCYSRTKEGTYVNSYDFDWNVHPEYSVFTDHYRDGKGAVPRPKGLEKMLEAASALSKGFPEVRVDFYEIAGKVYFGEMTFASLAGKMDFFTQDYLEELGRQCILPKK